MSLPNIIYGEFGDEKVTSTAKIGGLPPNALMILPDGSEWVHSRAGSVAVVVGKLYEGPAITADHGCGTADNLVVTAGALGATSVTLTTGGTTAILKDHYADGYLSIKDDTGEGLRYRIKSNNSAAAGSACVVTLDPKDPLTVAVAADSTTASLRKNTYDSIILKTANTVSLAPMVGVPAASCAASSWLWVCRKGDVPILADGTLIIGRPVVASSAIAGAVAAAPADTSTITNAGRVHVIGEVLVVSASAEYSLVRLRLE